MINYYLIKKFLEMKKFIIMFYIECELIQIDVIFLCNRTIFFQN